MVDHFEEVKEFISAFWSYNKNKITIEKSLDDLGMYGDDKKDFLMSFIEKFNIEASDLDYDKFCELEIFNPLKILFFRKNDEKPKIKIEHLINVVKKKRWFNP
ncbi:DUF1493 family protein [Pedobacter sp.]|uniref:DUF1493 family protein n=1 Tax=Pedobacter sp. TaxID=1411316 RepID=UPI00396CEA79